MTKKLSAQAKAGRVIKPTASKKVRASSAMKATSRISTRKK